MAVTLNANTSTGFIATSDTSGVLQLQTAGTTAVTVDASQNVGIGTASPGTFGKFAVAGADDAALLGLSSATGVLRARAYNTATTGAIVESTNASQSAYANLFLNGLNLLLGTGNTERMRIDSSGNVGIGTSSPSAKLDVVGTISTSAIYTSNRANAGSYTSGSSLELKIDGTTYAAIRQPAAEVLAFYRGNGGTTETARIDSSGNLLVNTTTSGGWSGDALIASLATGSGKNWGLSGYNNSAGFGGAILARVDNTTRQLFSMYYTTTNVGNITTNGSVVTYGGTSDYRLKENVQPMTGALAKVALLKPCTFTWKNSGIEDDGFIAHELQEVAPNAVVGEKDAVNEDGSIKAQEIDPRFLIATLTAAIQEQQALITQLQADVAALKGTTP